MPGPWFAKHPARLPGTPHRQGYSVGVWIGFMICVLSLLSSGCPAPIPYTPPPILSPNMTVPRARHLLKTTLLRSLTPQILAVEISEDFLLYRYRHAAVSVTTEPTFENRIALRNIGTVDAYTNNVVLIWTPSHLLLGQLIFGNYQDPRLCAELLLFLRDERVAAASKP